MDKKEYKSTCTQKYFMRTGLLVGTYMSMAVAVGLREVNTRLVYYDDVNTRHMTLNTPPYRLLLRHAL
jgi:hypothetical protein